MTAPPSTPMSAAHLRTVLEALAAAGVPVSLEGGWGVDALLGRQTREHADVDLAADRADCDRLVIALAGLGYHHDPAAWPGLPARLVLRDGSGHAVDVHPLLLDRHGNGWQELAEGGWLLHQAEMLRRQGNVDGFEVSCIAPELQLAFRLGYPWRPEDRHDLALLAEHFGIPLPPQDGPSGQ